MPTTSPSSHTWKFFRTGGIDQVALESGADLLALDQLDQKLWTALSCPVKGLELSERTLAFVDTDADGRIGVPEVLAAVKWAAERLADAGDLLKGADPLPLKAIQGATPEGTVLRAAARQILAGVGGAEAEAITVDQASEAARVFAASPLNGEGIISTDATDDPGLKALIKDIVDSVGGETRRSGAVGVSAAKIGQFFDQASAYAAWSELKMGREVAVLGDSTDEAYSAIKAVRPKVEDYFTRCRLAEYDARSAPVLNRSEADYVPLAAKELKLSAEEVAGFPLARIEAGRPLPLTEGVNPAWSGPLAALREKAAAPIWGAAKKNLALEEWMQLNAMFAAYEARLAENAGNQAEKIGLARIKEILGGKGREALAALVEKDKALEPEFKALSDVERLVRYHRDLRTLLHNFVNFADFYSPDRWASFQAGTLILDSRATELCIRVEAMTPMAAMSKMCIVSCACTRAGGGASMTIAACFTRGDSDFLYVGRNGIFYDRQGGLWYAGITGIIDNPISLREAFWSPYKKFVRFVDDQVAKRAAAAEAAAGTNLQTAVQAGAAAAKAPPPKFDLALITGIGVALGSIGTFCAAVFAKFVDVPLWHVPLILIALILVVSLPSVVIAALKLRQRTLGPLLEANGWAINGRVKINIPFGTALTKAAALPPGARRSLTDPYEDKDARRRKRLAWLAVVVVLLASAAVCLRLDHKQRGSFFWQPSPFSRKG